MIPCRFDVEETHGLLADGLVKDELGGVRIRRRLNLHHYKSHQSSLSDFFPKVSSCCGRILTEPNTALLEKIFLSPAPTKRYANFPPRHFCALPQFIHRTQPLPAIVVYCYHCTFCGGTPGLPC